MAANEEGPEPPAAAAGEAPADGIKIIFLDVDGVICCNGAGRLEVDKLARIENVVKKTDAKVVLSTDWRRDPSLKAHITTALNERGISVIGATRKGAPLRPIRPQEIAGWLDAYTGGERPRKVSQWVAVDDRELLSEFGGDRLKGHFVNTSFASGLTDKAAERMVAVLNGDAEQGMGAHTALREREARRFGSPAVSRGGGRGGRDASPARGRGRGGAARRRPGLARRRVPIRQIRPAWRGRNAATAPGGASRLWARAGSARPRRLARGRRRLRRPAARANSRGKAARTQAFGNGVRPGFMSPTCARSGGGSSSRPSTPGRGGGDGIVPSAAGGGGAAAAAPEPEEEIGPVAYRKGQ